MMGIDGKISPRTPEISRSLSSHAACGYKADSARKIVYDSQFRNDHAQAAKELVFNSLITTNSFGKGGRLDHLYCVDDLYSREVSPVKVIRVDKRGTNRPVVRSESLDRFRYIRRGMSDNVTGMNYETGLKLERHNSSSPNSPRESKQAKYGHVYLNIYDLENVHRFVNIIADTIGAGAYHAGVEIYGREYNYGHSTFGGTGIMQSFPRVHPSHAYIKSIDMGRTRLTPEEVTEMIDKLKGEWMGKDYDLLKRNCLNFANEFCLRLEVGHIPEWVMGLQNKINWTRRSLNFGAAKLKAFKFFLLKAKIVNIA